LDRPGLGFGLRHVALYVRDLAACERFYVELLGMTVEWRPDQGNVYLSSGGDNLALHQAPAGQLRDEGAQRLGHIGFFVATPADVDAWHQWLQSQRVPMRTAPRTHRDGARSFYCADPDGTMVQFIHHPPVNAWEARRGLT